MPVYETKTVEVIPADKYTVTVDSIEECVSPPPFNTEQLRVNFDVVGGEYDGKRLSWWCGRGIGKKYIALWVAFGVDAVGQNLDTDALYGRQCEAMVSIDKSKSTGEDYNKILSLVAKQKDKKTGAAPAPSKTDPFSQE